MTQFFVARVTRLNFASPLHRSPSPPRALPCGAMGAAYGTAKASIGMAECALLKPELLMKSLIPIVMAVSDEHRHHLEGGGVQWLVHTSRLSLHPSSRWCLLKHRGSISGGVATAV